MKRLLSSISCLMLSLVFFTGCQESADVFHAKTYASGSASISSIQIDVRDRKIAVELSPDDQIHIDYAESDQESYDLRVQENHTLVMASRYAKDWKGYIGRKPSLEDRTIHLQIPETTLANLSITTTNESLHLPDLHVADRLSVDINNGDIVFERLSVGNSLTLNAKNGRIDGTVVGGYDDFDITSNAHTGTSNLPARKEGGGKTLAVTTNNGDIQIDFQKGA